MINSEQTLPCPVCGTKIAFDTRELLKGVKFKCSNCDSAIGLADESRPLVQDAMDKFDELRNNAAKANPKI